ncbi:MAG TPA: OmpW family outer membrane protein [Thermoanaerobaculia bacterium]
MTRIKWIIAVATLVFPLALSAQTRQNELGFFVSSSQFDSTRIEDDELDFDVELDFDENIGFGVSYNRYWTNQLSTEFAAQRLGGDIQVSLVDGPTSITVDAGEIELTAFSGTLQWHFGGAGRFDPYIGGGLAYVTGDVDVLADPEEDPEATENVELENETTWLANAGVNFRITDALSIGADAKYIAYEPEAEGDDSGESLDVNPLVFSAGIKFRF